MKKGFTLIEIILSLAVLGIGLVSLLSVFVVGTNSVRRTVTMTESSFLAQMILEDLKSKGYDNLSTSVDKTFYPEYERNIAIDDVPGVTDLRSVEVTIKKGSYTQKFLTYIAKYEP